MNIGKLTNEKLNELVLSKLKHVRKEVVSDVGIGIDCAEIVPGNNHIVLSCDPITATSSGIGRLSVNVCCNDAVAAGAEPIGLMVTLLIPPSATEEEISAVVDEMVETASTVNVDIIGGHTEVTDSVTRIVTCTTVIAKRGGRKISSAMMRPGDAIIMTKTAGLEGTSIIVSSIPEVRDFLTKSECIEALGFDKDTSVVKEGLFAAKHGAHAMHDVTEGGIMGAVWEMSEASGCSISIDKSAIPIHPVTRKVCEHFSIDPLRLVSSGCLLIACQNGTEMLRWLRAIHIEANIIGYANDETPSRFVKTTDGITIEPPEADELYKVIKF